MSNSQNVAPPDSLINLDKGKEHWEGIASDIHGMLGGIPALMPSVSRVDLQGSRTFLARLGIGIKSGRKIVPRALEGGAGCVNFYQLLNQEQSVTGVTTNK